MSQEELLKSLTQVKNSGNGMDTTHHLTFPSTWELSSLFCLFNTSQHFLKWKGSKVNLEGLFQPKPFYSIIESYHISAGASQQHWPLVPVTESQKFTEILEMEQGEQGCVQLHFE